MPVRELLPHQLNLILLRRPHGDQVTLNYKTAQGIQRTYQAHFEGVIPNLQRRYREATTDSVKEDLERYMAERPCPACHGRRLKPEALAVTVAGRPIDQVTGMAVKRHCWSGCASSESAEGNLDPSPGARPPSPTRS